MRACVFVCECIHAYGSVNLSLLFKWNNPLLWISLLSSKYLTPGLAASDVISWMFRGKLQFYVVHIVLILYCQMNCERIEWIDFLFYYIRIFMYGILGERDEQWMICMKAHIHTRVTWYIKTCTTYNKTMTVPSIDT